MITGALIEHVVSMWILSQLFSNIFATKLRKRTNTYKRLKKAKRQKPCNTNDYRRLRKVTKRIV